MNKTKTMFHFADGTSQKITKGDIIEVVNGNRYIFLEMKRKNWVGQCTNTNIKYTIPSDPDYLIAVVGHDEKYSVNVHPVIKLKLKAGDLFALEGDYITYVFKHINSKGKIEAATLANPKTYLIDGSMEAHKVKVKETIKEILV